MKHDVVLEGFKCRLRPVREDDAEFIIAVRNQDRAAGKINATSRSIPAQVAWIRRYLDRGNDYYWIIENSDNCASVGTIGLYDFTPDGTEAMPGRWVMSPQCEINAMTPIFLMYGFAFETLCLRRLAICVMPDNRKIIRFHLLCGAHDIAVPERYAQAEAESGVRQRWLSFSAEDWSRMKAEWTPILKRF